MQENRLYVTKVLLLIKLTAKGSEESQDCTLLMNMELTQPTGLLGKTPRYVCRRWSTDDRVE